MVLNIPLVPDYVYRRLNLIGTPVKTLSRHDLKNKNNKIHIIHYSNSFLNKRVIPLATIFDMPIIIEKDIGWHQIIYPISITLY